VIDRLHPLRRLDQGWFEATVREARAGTRYRFRIDEDVVVPDPASRFQPEDVHGPSEVVDPDYAWQASDWRGRPWHEAVMGAATAVTLARVTGFRSIPAGRIPRARVVGDRIAVSLCHRPPFLA